MIAPARRIPRWLVVFVGLTVVPVALAACATRGGQFPTDKIPHIQEDVTTSDEIIAWFGKPVSTRRESSGFSAYRYLHESEQTRDTGTLTRIGAFIGRFFGFSFMDRAFAFASEGAGTMARG